MNRAILCLLLLASTVINAQVPADWKTFERTGFAIKYPSDWELNTTLPGAVFAVTSPASSESDDFSENVNLIVQDLAGKNVSLDMYTQVSVKQINAMLPRSSILLNETATKNGLTYQHLIYKGFMYERMMRFEQFYWIREEKAFVLTFTSSEDAILEFEQVGKLILNSFIFKV